MFAVPYLMAGLSLALGTVTATPSNTKASLAGGFAERNLQLRQTQLEEERTRSTVWSGGQVIGSRYKSVSAEITIPDIAFPYGGGRNPNLTYSASAWVGIGGDPNVCDDAGSPVGLLQVGFYWLWNPEGDAGVFAFHEWIPDPPVMLDATQGIKTAVGDRVRFTVTQEQNTTGTIFWENLTTKETYPKDGVPLALTAPAEGSLCTNHAEWIVESFMTKEDQSYRFPDFGTLKFEHLRVFAEEGEAAVTADLGGAYILEAEPFLDELGYLTNCYILGADQTTCDWLGYADVFKLAE